METFGVIFGFVVLPLAATAALVASAYFYWNGDIQRALFWLIFAIASGYFAGKAIRVSGA